MITEFLPLIFHRGSGTENRLFELQGDIGAQIRATLSPRPATPCAASEEIAEAEQVTEDIAEITEDDVGIEAEPATCGADAGVPKAIVLGALLRITKH